MKGIAIGIGIGIGHLVVFLFRRCITFCKECELYVISPVLQPMTSTAKLALFAKSYTSAKQGDDEVTESENTRDVGKDDQNASKPVAGHFNLPNHSKQHMTVCGVSLHQGSTESLKTLEQNFLFEIGTLNPNGMNKHFSFN